MLAKLINVVLVAMGGLTLALWLLGQIAAVWGVLALALGGTVYLLGAIAHLYRKVGPHEALIVFGFRGTRIIKGNGTVVFPMLESSHILSLELMSFDVAPEKDLYTRQGVSVSVEAVAQIKVRSEPVFIRTAAEQLLTKRLAEREALIRLVMEGHLRGIVGQLSVEEIVKQPELVSERIRATCAEDMGKMGLEIVSFTIKEVRDKNEYVANMGRPDVARIRRDADVATAEAERDTAIRQALAQREAAVARAQADRERVEAEARSLAQQAEAQRDLELRRAEFAASVKRQQAQTDASYDIEAHVMQQRMIAERIKAQQVDRRGQVELEEIEIERRERELTASVLKPTEVERKRIEMLAEAERQRLASEAAGQAAAITQRGAAEATVILQKGQADATAMHAKALAYQQFTQAAVADRLISGLPEVVRALTAPLANVDRITVVSTGGEGGLDRISGDLARVVAHVPALFEGLTGLRTSELLSRIPGLKDHHEPTRTPTAPATEERLQ